MKTFKNHYALITGASEGFGKSLAIECASRNINLVLVALPGSGVENVASCINEKFGVKVFSFEHDLSIKEECYILFNEIRELRISINILINNAGVGGTHYFEERNADYYHKQIELNVVAPTLLCRLFLKSLERHTPAYILNVSSLASYFYLPKKQVYGGTKSYLVSFSKSLRRELKRSGICVSVVCPGGMNTNASLIQQNSLEHGISKWSIMNPEDVAKIAIRDMFKGKEVIIPGFWNNVFMFLDFLLPKSIKEWLTDRQMKRMRSRHSLVVKFSKPVKTAI